MEKQRIHTDKAPAAVGPYSQGIMTEALIFLSGQIGLRPETGKLAEGGVQKQAEQVFKNISALLAEAGSGMAKVLKVTVFLRDMADFKKVNELYAGMFTEPYPARSTFAVAGLPLDAAIEIEVTAAR